jgi:trehalose 6-phosphate synthase
VSLVALLATLAVTATWMVGDRLQTWADEDLTRRAALAVNGAREALELHQQAKDEPGMRKILEGLTRDERLLSAAFCDPHNLTLAATSRFPKALDCSAADSTQADGSASSNRVKLNSGIVHLSVVPLEASRSQAGFVMLVHELTWLDRRESETQALLWVAFGLCALTAAGAAFFTARLSVRGVRDELKSLFDGRRGTGAFAPLIADVREWMEERQREEGSSDGEAWTPARLKATLWRQLEGERVTVVANREPYVHHRRPSGEVVIRHPASGLVTALEPVMRACGGVWVAHGGGSADRESSDAKGRVRVPPGEESYLLRRVWLTDEEERGYYYGFSNEGLWPLCHQAHQRPDFRGEDWRWYQDVNRKFADAVCEEVETDDAVILIQDYHFALLPGLLRARLPRATLITFWHIPWPSAERFGICPWREELLDGMLGSSILGFHTQQHCNNLLESVDRFLEARIDRERNAVVRHGWTTLVRPYPISVEWPSRWVEKAPSVAECRAQVRQQLGVAEHVKLGVGVDRLDYTKGIEERLLAVERLFELHPEWVGKFSFVQLAAPSRTEIAPYRLLHEHIAALTETINGRFGREDWKPVLLFEAHHEPPEVFRHYRAAELCYVSSLHDGMNLVAKEFVSARDDEQGVLVLSHFTGAARELAEALVVNPYDLDAAAEAMHAALSMPLEEQRDRMRAMRAVVREFNVYRWAGRMLVDAARVRRRDRLSGRLRVG